MRSQAGESLRIAVFGLGEAGSLIASDLVSVVGEVRAFDPKPLDAPDGVLRCHDPRDAVEGADFVLALTASADAITAMEQAASSIAPGAVYADFSTSSVHIKERLAETASVQGFLFADIALLGIVPGNGMYTPSIASGDGATQFAECFVSLGARVECISDSAGEAAARKLLRSIFMKGVAAVSIEALATARHFGLEDWLWKNMVDELERADETWIRRLVGGTELHAKRRREEMEAAAELIESVSEEPLLTRGTVANFDRVESAGLPTCNGLGKGEDN